MRQGFRHLALRAVRCDFTRTARCLLIALPALLATVASAGAAPPPIPDDWFFDGANRPAPLRALEGKPAPELELESWIGEPVKISEQRGKVIVVDFWATWCGPCMAAIPENVDLVKKHGVASGGDLVFIGVHDSSNGFDRAAAVVKDKKINYPVAKDVAKNGGASTKAYNLQFWPTYVVIDREGVVRAAGLTPNNVAKVVEMLLGEAAPAGSPSGGSSEFPPTTFVGGVKRPAALRALEGKPMPALAVQAWAGGTTQPEALADWMRTASKGAVIAVQFVKPGGTLATKALREFAALEKEFEGQGVVLVAVCDVGGDLAKLEAAAKELKSTMVLVKDAPADDGEAAVPTDGKAAKPKSPAEAKLSKRGATTRAFGAELLPATFVIDRKGVVRAAGVKTDRMKEVVEKLLAEEVR